MEEKDKIIVKWAQKDVETSNNLLNYNKILFSHVQLGLQPVPFLSGLPTTNMY